MAGVVAFAIAQPRIAGEFLGAFDPARTPIDSVAIGGCFEGTEAEEDETIVTFGVQPVDCAAPHAGEVIGRFTLEGAIADETFYPGDEAVAAEAERGCLEHFESYVGIDYQSSVLELQSYYPLSRGWVLGDRQVSCTAFGPAGESLQGSVRGTSR